MEGLSLVGLVNPHVGVIAAQSQINHMAEQVTFCILRSGIAQVRPESEERSSAQVERPLANGQGAHQHHPATADDLAVDRLEPRREGR